MALLSTSANNMDLITMSFFAMVHYVFTEISHAVNGSDHHISPPEVFQKLHNTSVIGEDDDINSKQTVAEILKKLLDEAKYDSDLRPTGLNGSGPVIVNVSIYIRSIDNIDDQKMEYSIQLTLRQIWIDPRLKYSHIQSNIQYLNLVSTKRIWMPDLFFLNEKTSSLHQLMIPNMNTRIYSSGRVFQSYRITLTMACNFDLRRFPMDKQSCPIHIEAYGWTSKDLLVKWMKKPSVEVYKKLNYNMARFVFKNYSIDEKCLTVHSSGKFSCVQLYLYFSRQLGFYIIQIYVPCAMLVILSWFSFWLEPKAMEARISIGVTTILTVVTLTYGINETVPPSSYIKAIDMWTSFCQAMVFGATLQFSIVNHIFHKKTADSNKLLVFTQFGNSVAKKNNEMEAQLAHCRAKKIDVVSRIMFPVIFILFNIAYWPAYIF